MQSFHSGKPCNNLPQTVLRSCQHQCNRGFSFHVEVCLAAADTEFDLVEQIMPIDLAVDTASFCQCLVHKRINALGTQSVTALLLMNGWRISYSDSFVNKNILQRTIWRPFFCVFLWSRSAQCSGLPKKKENAFGALQEVVQYSHFIYS